ncbi:glycoside hydrolase superfamily [Lipomyces japonicus]|uniref:glycoside hydrolase superfamily n=1 Tax=Lipomyces japonicus TaxID=56871 RepID=UPI0034CD129E
MASIDVEKVLQELTVNEKISLLAGSDIWHTVPIPRLGIPALRLTDGPNGVRGTKFFDSVPAACFPCGTGLAATWDYDLLVEAGKVMGEEAKAKGAHVILGPTINMQRSPLGGRGFESFSEDPILAGLSAGAVINGIQSTDVIATAKHFVGNDHEDRRTASDCIISQRALREIYLKSFQVAIKDSKPLSIMTAYNKVNGIHVSENPFFLKHILRDEWKWEGFIMSDWYGTYSTSDAINAGLDLEMPGPTDFRGQLVNRLLSANKIRQSTLDERVRAILKAINHAAKTGISGNAEEKGANTPETATLLRKITADSIVVLKNDNNVLPLSKTKTTAVIGPNAKITTYSGGGSASLRPYYTVTPFEGIEAKVSQPLKYTIGTNAFKNIPPFGSSTKTPEGKPGVRFTAFAESSEVSTRQPIDELVLPSVDAFLVDYQPPNIDVHAGQAFWAELVSLFTPTESGTYEFGVTVAGTAKLYVDNKLIVDNATVQRQGDAFFGNGTLEETGQIELEAGKEYEIKIDYGSALTSKLRSKGAFATVGGIKAGYAKLFDKDDEVQRAVEIAKQVDQVVLSIGLNSDWESEGYDRNDLKLPDGTDKLVAAVLAVNRNTVVVVQSGTPVELPWADDANAIVHAWYGGNETGNGIADVLFGDVNPSGKLSLSFPKRVQDNPAYLNYKYENGRVLYGEDVYIGYRFYEATDKEVLFPFGHGLSYSQFSVSGLKVSVADGKIQASVSVANVSGPAGKEVIQLYVAQQNPSVSRPRKELKAFKKVSLEPGQSKLVEFELEQNEATSFYDENEDAWTSEADVYKVLIGTSSDKIIESAEFSVAKTIWWKGL